MSSSSHRRQTNRIKSDSPKNVSILWFSHNGVVVGIVGCILSMLPLKKIECYVTASDHSSMPRFPLHTLAAALLLRQDLPVPGDAGVAEYWLPYEMPITWQESGVAFHSRNSRSSNFGRLPTAPLFLTVFICRYHIPPV
ncbi:hypothetical protein BDN72DRAFT_296382 [Pluteus cervinus]|uniref:Uncharacterized protein n=1 Tax=Pluteus cervinus TaxID=181527 RepID=A0ACD3B381_9AGAR|nr:hypothetical protein BDN72DRAFT_296382 [Pluteus cervinus]